MSHASDQVHLPAAGQRECWGDRVGVARSDPLASAAGAPANHRAPEGEAPGPLAVIIPVKRLDQAKSRLAEVLSPRERTALVQRLLDRALRVVQEARLCSLCLVVSADPTIRAQAVAAGASAVDEAGPGEPAGHNRALERARAALPEPTRALLVLSADLPLLVAADLRAMVALAPSEPAVVLAPDRDGRGTNALLLRPPSALPFVFGVDSFRRHQELAQACGLPVQIYRSLGTAFDLDLPEHLDELGLLGGFDW